MTSYRPIAQAIRNQTYELEHEIKLTKKSIRALQAKMAAGEFVDALAARRARKTIDYLKSVNQQRTEQLKNIPEPIA